MGNVMKRIRIIIWDDSIDRPRPFDIREFTWDQMYRKDGKFTAAGQESINHAIKACSEGLAYMTTEIFYDGKD